MDDTQAAALDDIVRSSLTAFVADLRQAGWRGKEHDCINRFVHCFLVQHVAPDSILSHLGQVRIEGGVPQPPGTGSKNSARKHLVIWSTDSATCWDDQPKRWNAVQTPWAILEWKADLLGRKTFEYDPRDLAWLTAAARAWLGFVGYAVLLHRAGLRGGSRPPFRIFSSAHSTCRAAIAGSTLRRPTSCTSCSPRLVSTSCGLVSHSEV